MNESAESDSGKSSPSFTGSSDGGFIEGPVDGVVAGTVDGAVDHAILVGVSGVTDGVDVPPHASLPAETPLSYRIEITVDASFVAKLERARAIFSRGRLNASIADVFERALDDFLLRQDPEERMARRRERAAKQNAKAASSTMNRPEPTPMSSAHTPRQDERAIYRETGACAAMATVGKGMDRPSSTVRKPYDGSAAAFDRYIPVALRDEVWCRDGGRCTHVGPEGRCPETHGLQIDHDIPVILGGLTELSNLRLLCSLHNQSEADRILGKDFMDLRRRRTPAPGVQEPVCAPEGTGSPADAPVFIADCDVRKDGPKKAVTDWDIDRPPSGDSRRSLIGSP